MDMLRMIESSGIVSFTNEGISRSNKECLQCVITFERLRGLIPITGRSFASIDVLSAYMEASVPGLSGQREEEMITYSDAANTIEIIATVADDLSVSVAPEDIEAQSSFQVFLRVQH